MTPLEKADRIDEAIAEVKETERIYGENYSELMDAKDYVVLIDAARTLARLLREIDRPEDFDMIPGDVEFNRALRAKVLEIINGDKK